MLINIKNVFFSYNKKTNAINGLNLKIKLNTIHAILGHNGAGKTTLFKLIMGILRCKDGSIVINKDIVDNKRDISRMTEFNGFYSELTVYENLVFRYQISNQPLQSMTKRIELILKTFDLTDEKNHLVKNLSQGLKKRTALACAIIGKPKLLMLDEPTNGVDPKSFEVLIKVLLQLKKNGTHIIVSSHNLNFVTKVADEITIINEGKDVYHGSTKDLDEKNLQELYFSYTNEDEEDDYDDL